MPLNSYCFPNIMSPRFKGSTSSSSASPLHPPSPPPLLQPCLSPYIASAVSSFFLTRFAPACWAMHRPSHTTPRSWGGAGTCNLPPTTGGGTNGSNQPKDPHSTSNLNCNPSGKTVQNSNTVTFSTTKSYNQNTCDVTFRRYGRRPPILPHLVFCLIFLLFLVLGGGLVAMVEGASAASSVDSGHPPAATETDEYKRDFDEFDANKDGMIDAYELRLALQTDSVSPSELYPFFLSVDKDSSGSISETEYMEYALTM